MSSRVLAPQSQSHPSSSLILLEHQAHLESQHQHFLQLFPGEPGSETLSTYYCQTLVLFEFLKTVPFILFHGRITSHCRDGPTFALSFIS